MTLVGKVLKWILQETKASQNIMKKKNQKNADTEKAYGFGEVMFMLENMNDGIQIIAEQQVDMKKDIDIIKEDISEINVRLGGVEDRLGNVEDNVIEIKHKLSEKVDREEFNKLEKRMIKLEKLVFAKIA
ncbi:MAG: hypothetical protein ACD_11C00057G0014 [uncultured bacterium]|nr:MAG: hypothetical protein ACD_11C00057G0014 [uncultured bacterium]